MVFNLLNDATLYTVVHITLWWSPNIILSCCYFLAVICYLYELWYKYLIYRIFDICPHRGFNPWLRTTDISHHGRKGKVVGTWGIWLHYVNSLKLREEWGHSGQFLPLCNWRFEPTGCYCPHLESDFLPQLTQSRHSLTDMLRGLHGDSKPCHVDIKINSYAHCVSFWGLLYQTIYRNRTSNRSLFTHSHGDKKSQVKVTAELGFPEDAGTENDLFKLLSWLMEMSWPVMA